MVQAGGRGRISCLGTIDRLVYPNWDSLVGLGAAAAVTERIALTTSVLLAPPRESAAVIAKQGATIHVLSGGRFVLGTALGGRDDDFEPFGVSTKGRGKRLDEMLDLIKRLWAGEEVGYAGGVGPDCPPTRRRSSSVARPMPPSGAPPSTATAG